ncbi:MAG: aldo/keto reductase [Acetobacteraceae bacterium]|jgi:aryl-alcohol dehydrogenase-like predicted oxidoreductase
MMDYTTLGRTGLRVSVAGLGTGGFSRIGIGQSEDHAVGIIRQALDLGVNLIDTAAVYGTEPVVGRALQGVARDSVVVCTKASKPINDPAFTVAKILQSLDGSLTRLGLDYVDVFQLHAVPPAAYDYVRNEIVPALLREKQKGKFRFLGITETSPNDHEQVMMQRAAADTPWDTAMFAFNLMAQVAREQVFPLTLKNKVGTLMMFAVRSIFARPEQLSDTMKDLAAKGLVPAELAASDEPLGFLVHPDGASSVTDAAYRYVRHEPGVDVMLFGTGDPEHLRANIASILKPPLPEADQTKLRILFSHLRGVGLELPPFARERRAAAARGEGS